MDETAAFELLDDRKQMAREVLQAGIEEVDLQLHPDPDLMEQEAGLTADLGIAFPEGLAPIPQPPDPNIDTTAPLPRADVLVVTWTVDENDALADVLTPGFGRAKWHRYNRRFQEHYLPLIRPGAPARAAKRIGSWLMTQIGPHSVLCYKSELHLNQDGITDAVAPGEATLPVKDMFQQLIEEVQPKVVLTVGTSGGLYEDHDLGDTALTRAAKFRLTKEFKNAPYNDKVYRSEWEIPTQHFEKATELMQAFAGRLAELPLLGPTARHKGKPYKAPTWKPAIKQDGTGEIPEFHPILTTDYFEYGTSTNGLQNEGIAVEMGDAVLGLVAEEMDNPPRWAVLRNLSDPQINGKLEKPLADMYAVYYYKKYGYWTSVMSSLATWAVIAGLED
jgi:nucleoside phosphorylase